MQDGKRLAILIEDTSADLLKKVQEILSVATAELVVGLTDPVANDIPVPQETSQPVQNMSGNEPIQEQPAQVQPKEAAPQSTVSTPFRFPNGKKHGGETVCDVIASGRYRVFAFHFDENPVSEPCARGGRFLFSSCG